MPATRRTAVSYSRFSDPKQAAGDSLDRQDRDYRAFCERHNLTPGKEVFADRGKSGYHDEHHTKGRLGELIAAAKDGKFDPGTVVVVEAWDRLGRLRPDRQTKLVAELLETGVSIGVCRLDDVFCEDDFGTHKWTTLAVFIQLAHQESKQKADRVAASWERRRQRARDEGTLVGSRLPAWVEVVGGKPRLIPERAAAVRRIYELAADGLGHTRIVRALQAEKVPAFGERVVREGRQRSQFSGRWSRSYVVLLLRDRRVLGEYQPQRRDKAGVEHPDGPPLVGYYPAAITADQFNLARAALAERNSRNTNGRPAGPRQRTYVNVFRGMLTHARDGGGFTVHNRLTTKNPKLSLMATAGVGGGSRYYTFPLPVLESAVLAELKEIDPSSVLPRRPGGPSRVEALRATLANLREDIARTQRDMKKDGYSKAIAEVLRQYEAEEEETANDLQDELARTAKPLARAWEELPSLIDVIRGAEDPDLARLKLRTVLRAVLESAVLLIVSVKSWRFAALQFHFTGGTTRHYLVAYQPAANGRPGATWGKSFADAGVPGDLDLRDKKDAAELEAALTKLDLQTLTKPA
jgi:DNA invertase Pin-like site-specific DNA recombinase